MEIPDASATTQEIIKGISEAVIADQEFFETVLVGVLARSHVLLEDVPGTGKTLTARSLAQALDLSFSRIQFTPDLLPADITGSNIYDEATGEFRFAPGPVFENIVLADEINRAPPKTQAALLEAMEEGQVSVDGETHELPTPFFVIATQNPVEQSGTFALPEAQRDRFIVKTSIGYPDREGERTLIDRRAERIAQFPTINPVIDRSTVTALREVSEKVEVDGKIRDYILDLGRATRDDQRVEIGVSPRGIQRLFESARSMAVLNGREYVVPDDVKQIVRPVFRHRIVLTDDASVRGTIPADIIDSILNSVEVPGAAGGVENTS